MDKLVFLAFFCFHILVVSFGVANGTQFSLCSQTPYPELCNSLVISRTNIGPQATLERTTFNIRDSALRFTLSQATQVHKLISTMDVSSFNHLAKSAWADCLELYEDTIDKLNRSIGSHNPSTLNDVQTWLSAAVANQETCRNGFIDFNLSFHLQSLPFLRGNFSKHLSNSLAINKAAASAAAAALSSAKQVKGRRLLQDGFPEWVSVADRKLFQSSNAPIKADIVVAQDGSGNYMTISEALAASKRSGGKRFVIYVKKGVYKEIIEIKKSMKNLMFIGDGIDATIVTGSKNVADGSTTFGSATFAVSGEGFIARGMTFENTAGPQKAQAVALLSGSDRSVFYSCSFKGYQHTLYVYSQRQFYRDCNIYGTIDFIMGDAAVVFQNCNIYVRKSMRNNCNTITAQARKDPNENTGIIIHNSRVTAAEAQGSIKTYLGRPWETYSRTVIMRTYLDSMIDPAGWLPWNGNFALSTLYYGEYMNSGPGSGTSGRVKWGGYHVITSVVEAGQFSAGNFFDGEAWILGTGVPFTLGL